MRLTEIKDAEIHHLHTIVQQKKYKFAMKACNDNQKKNMLNSNISLHVLTIWWTSAH